MPPPPKAPQPHKLFLTTNSVYNTTFANDSDTLYFEIRTPRWEGQKQTRVKQLDGDMRHLNCVAEIQGDKVKASRVRFISYSEKGQLDDNWMNSRDWLQSGSSSGGAFLDKAGVRYTWITHRGHLRLLRDDDEGDKKVFVQYHAPRRVLGVLTMRRHAYLEVDPALTDSLDRVIVSYLLIERRRKAKIPLRFKLMHADSYKKRAL